jgi:catechol 2,3-dioxygenase-like lactoylglutathione lyase family enzyme
MGVKALDHVNIRTRDVESSARFYVGVLLELNFTGD